MTLATMITGIAIAALVFYLAQIFISGEKESFIIRYLQSFVGILFLFSGFVKAIDPLGTAYKMEQYFAEFESVFEPTWFSFIAPLFPVLKEYAIGFSVFMIVFEIVLGFTILVGIYKKISSWALFLLVLFFLVLTGFTYLTGYVPQDGTFFNFSSWSSFDANNMKVKDCGCFGDFIKLEPFTSFLKDVFLLIPSILFLLYHKKMYTVLKEKWALGSTLLLTAITTVYCFSNYIWDLPHEDFRPFKEGVNIATEKERELAVASNVQVIGFLMKNKKDPSRKIEIKTNEYSAYSDEWEVLEQIRTEPTEKPTKISEFELNDIDGNSNTYVLLEDEKKSVVIVSHSMKGKVNREMQEVIDTVVVIDTDTQEETINIVKNKVEKATFVGKNSYMSAFTSKVVPFAKEAKLKGYNVYFAVAGSEKAEILDFLQQVDLDAEVFTADDILLKTIIRSNPGILLMEGGEILKKYHISKLPEFSNI